MIVSPRSPNTGSGRRARQSTGTRRHAPRPPDDGVAWFVCRARRAPDPAPHRGVLAAPRRHLGDDGGGGAVPGRDHRAAGAADREPGRVRGGVRARHHHRGPGHHADGRLDRPRHRRRELRGATAVRVHAGGGADPGAGRRGSAPGVRPARRLAHRPAARRGPPDLPRARHHAAVADRHRVPPVPAGSADPPPPDPPRHLRHRIAARGHERRRPRRGPGAGAAGRARGNHRARHRSRRRGGGQPLHDPGRREGAPGRPCRPRGCRTRRGACACRGAAGGRADDAGDLPLLPAAGDDVAAGDGGAAGGDLLRRPEPIRPGVAGRPCPSSTG